MLEPYKVTIILFLQFNVTTMLESSAPANSHIS